MNIFLYKQYTIRTRCVNRGIYFAALFILVREIKSNLQPKVSSGNGESTFAVGKLDRSPCIVANSISAPSQSRVEYDEKTKNDYSLQFPVLDRVPIFRWM